MVIVDDGTCSPGFSCGIQGNKKERTSWFCGLCPLTLHNETVCVCLVPGKGYSWRDRREAWDDVFIPSVLVSEENGSRLKSVSLGRKQDLL